MADLGRHFVSEDYHELPEFLRFNKYGSVLNKDERKQVAKTKGVCSTCGRSTHKVTPFRSIPLDNEFVQRGVCLKCHPESKVSFDETPPAGTAGKAVRFLGGRAETMRNLRRSTTSDTGRPELERDGSKMGRHLRNVLTRSTMADQQHDGSKMGGHLRHTVDAPRRDQITKREGSLETTPQLSPGEDVPLSSSDRQISSTTRNSLLAMHHKYRSEPTPRIGSLDDISDCGENDAWDIVKKMRAHPDDVEVLAKTCYDLRNLGTNQAGSLFEIIEVMKRFPNEKSLQIASIGALWSLSADGSNDNKLEILNAGGSEVVLNALENFPKNITLLAWGLGALSSLGEATGGQAYLEDDGVVENIEDILNMICEANYNGEVVFYWLFRCLVTLICDYTEVNRRSDIDVDDIEDDFDAAERSRNTIANTEIVHLALLSIESVPMDGVTLEMAFKFLSHFGVENYNSQDKALLVGACEKAIQKNPHASFPTLHHLACAILCLTDLSDNEEECRKANIFISVALDVLTAHVHRRHSSSSSGSASSTIVYEPPHSLDVMVSTLAHLLCYGNITLESAESKSLLEICYSIIKHEERCVGFLHGSCCWIIWNLFRSGPASIKNQSLALKASEAIQFALPNIEYSPTLLTVGFSALSKIAILIDLEADHHVKMIVRLVSKYSNVEMLRKNACLLLFNLCKTKEIAAHIVSAGALDAVNKPSDGRPCSMTVHLMIKVSSFAGNDALSLEDLKDMVNASERLKTVSPLAAVSWLNFLAASVSPDRKVDFTESVPMAISSIKEIMESFPENTKLQSQCCLALRNVAVSIQKSGFSLDISASISAVLSAQKEHGVQIHKECCDALWALMGVECQLEHTLSKEIVYFAIEVTEIHVVSTEHKFRDEIVAAGMAIFADTFSDPVRAMHVLGEKVVDIVVDVVNTTIYSYLDRQSNHPLIFQLGFSTLHRLSNDDLSREIIVNHGGVVSVVDGMMANLENASIQENGCNILRNLAGDDLGMKLNIVEADGVDVIMNIMISHGENASVLSEAFQALACLSVDSSSRNFIAQQGGVMLIASSMSTLSESVQVQETGLAALCNLASDVEEDILQVSNIFSVVNESLDHHAKNACIQRQGFALFYNLSMRSEGIKSSLLSSGCLNNVVKALQNNLRNSNVVSSALRLLINLSDSAEGMQVLRDDKAITSIIHVMMLNVENLKIAIVGCKILNLSCEMSPNQISIGFGGVEAAVYAMMFHHSSEKVQYMGCRILSRSSLNSPNDGIFDADFFDLNCKILEALLSAMSSFPKSFKIQEHATIALRNMSKLEENTPILYTEQSRLEDALTETMIIFPQCQKNCEAVLAVLGVRLSC